MLACEKIRAVAKMYDLNDIQIKEKIGSGGMAEIFKVTLKGARGFKKRCVLKQIRSEYISNKEFTDSLINEAHIVEKLNHANIVQVYQLGDIGNTLGILMEYVDGVDLGKILYHLNYINKTMPRNLALFIIKQICLALQYAHNKTDDDGCPLDIVHRDINPQNILVSKDGWVKITDFGIAKASTKTTKTIYGTLKGKLRYMSPEQALCKEIDYRSDIFSVGILTYELLTGKRLFDADSEIKIINKVQNFELSELKKIVLPNDLVNIICKTLEPDKNNRYQNCSEIIHNIDDYIRITGHSASTQELADFTKSLIQPQRRKTDDKRQYKLDYPEPAPTVEIKISQLKDRKWTFAKKLKLRYLGYLALPFLALLVLMFITYKDVIKIDPPNETQIPHAMVTEKPKAESASLTMKTLPKEVKAKVKYGRLEVFAKPWGYVSVSGVASRKTSPYKTSKIKPGTYKVSVFYEPEDKTVTKTVNIVMNKRTFCTVDFLAPSPALKCK